MPALPIGEFARRTRLSVKALHLYDERGVLVSARVDPTSGYRYYDVAQLDDAQLILMMRQLEVPLATVKELRRCEPADAARRIASYWRDTEAVHASRRELAHYLVDLLSGRKTMNEYEVGTRDMPERSLLCLKRHVDEEGSWTLGKEFVAILRERPLPRLPGREGATFSIYWGQVSSDSDGPIEWCVPIPTADAKALAPQYPELTVRTEPAHQAAFVALPPGAGDREVQWELASQALHTWVAEHGVTSASLFLSPEDLGVRITYLASTPVMATSFPDRDFAAPFAVDSRAQLTNPAQ